MKRIWVAAAFALLSGAAIADGYQDFNAGIAAKNREEDAIAVTYLTSALGAPDLPEFLRATAYRARGGIYSRAGRLDAANADFTAAIKLRPDDIAALQARGLVEVVQGRNAEALADFEQAIALQPDNFLLYGDLFNLELRTKNFAAVIASYTDFITKRPKDPVPVDGRARAELAAGQFDNSIADANATIAIYSKWADPYSIKGTDYLVKGDFKNALSEVNDAIDRDENTAVLYLQRGFADWFLGDTNAAVRTLDESLEKDPHEDYTFIWLNIAMARQGKPVPANIAAHFSDVTEAKWPGPLMLLYLGRMQPDAVLKVTGPDPDTLGSKECAVRFFVGEWYASLGKPADAKPLLQAAAGDLCAGAPMYARFAQTDMARLRELRHESQAARRICCVVCEPGLRC